MVHDNKLSCVQKCNAHLHLHPTSAPKGVRRSERLDRRAHCVAGSSSPSNSSSCTDTTPAKVSAGSKMQPPPAPRRRKALGTDDYADDTDEISGDVPVPPAAPARALASVPQLLQHMNVRPAAAAEPFIIMGDDLPIAGPPFAQMQTCKDMSLPKLNSESSEHFQECYYANDLPIVSLETLAKEIGMDAQVTARLEAGQKELLPHNDGPPRTRMEEKELWMKCIPLDNVEHIKNDGTVYITNDTHRKCLADNCEFLSYCKIQYEAEKTTLCSYSSCSRFCQLAMLAQMAAASKKAGRDQRFMYPSVGTVPMMTRRAWEHWKIRFEKESNSRRSIAQAFDAYKKIYGKKSAEAIVALSVQHPETSAELPTAMAGEGHDINFHAVGTSQENPAGRALLRTVSFRPEPSYFRAGQDTATAPIMQAEPLSMHGTNDSTENHAVHGTKFSTTTAAVGELENLSVLTEENRDTVHSGKEEKFDKKDFSRSKVEKRRNSRENERKILLERKSRRGKTSPTNKRTPSQLAKELLEQIDADRAFQQQPLDTVIPHFSTFTEHHFAAGTQRLFIKGASKDSGIPERFMPVSCAFDTDNVQLYDYCARNNLLESPEITDIFNLESEKGFVDFTKHTVKEPLRETTARITGTARTAAAVPQNKAVSKSHKSQEKGMLDLMSRETRPSPVNMYGHAKGEEDGITRNTLGISREHATNQANPLESKCAEKVNQKDTREYGNDIRAFSSVPRTSSRGGTVPEGTGNSMQPRAHGKSRHDVKSRSVKPSVQRKPHDLPRRTDSTDSEDDDKKRKRAGKHEDAISDGTSDTDDYDTSSSENTSDEEKSTRKGRNKKSTSNSKTPVSGTESDGSERINTESDEGTWLDTASDSDDSSSDSDLDIRASQHKSYRRKRAAEKLRRPAKHGRAKKRDRSRSRSPKPRRLYTKGTRDDSKRNKISESNDDRSRSPEQSSKSKDKQATQAAPWKADFEKWSSKRTTKRHKESRRNKKDRNDEKRHKTVSKKKSRRSQQRESLSSLGVVEHTEHVHLGAMSLDMINLLKEQTDESDGENADDMMTETATLAVSASVEESSSSSSTSSDDEPPIQFFDELLEKPEHRARIEEGGMTRALYLEKVIKAPNKELGDMYYDLAKKRHQDREKEKVPRSLQYPERLSENAKFKAGSQIDSIQWRKLFMSECAFVKEVYLTPLCLRSALDPKVASAVRANFSREKFKGQYEAERSDFIPFDSVCRFLKRTYDRPGRKEAALLDYLTLFQGKGSVRDLITTRTNKLSILTRLGAKPLNDDLDRALVLRALSAPLSEFITSRPHHLTYSVDEIFRIAKTRELAVNNASRSSRNESLNYMDKRGRSNRNNSFQSNPRPKPQRYGNRFSQKGHLNAAIRKNTNRATSRRPHKASLFAYGNKQSEPPRVSTRLFRTNYSDAEWSVRVGPDGKIKPGVNPKDPRHRNSFNKDTVEGKPWCLICKTNGHDMISCRAPSKQGQGKGKGKGKGKGNNRGGGRGQHRGSR